MPRWHSLFSKIIRNRSVCLYHGIFQIQASLQKMVPLPYELDYLSLNLLVMGQAC
uniref:Uncharacterized protein n=1 Tax=Arundo donax TaxID=35708 RepID=A0A0A9D1Y9_ARUDO